MLKVTEEEKIVAAAKEKLEGGYGLNYDSLADLVQECLIAVSRVNPERTIQKWQNNRPDRNFCFGFAQRHGLVYRTTMGISSARGSPTKSMVMRWFVDSVTRFSREAVFRDIFSDPRRVFNQDESGFNCSAIKNQVLAPKGMKGVPYQREPANPHENISVSLTVNAAGEVCDVLLLFKGKYNVAKEKLKDLPSDGVTGEWRTAVNDSGYMTRDVFEDEVLPGNNIFLLTCEKGDGKAQIYSFKYDRNTGCPKKFILKVLFSRKVINQV